MSDSDIDYDALKRALDDGSECVTADQEVWIQDRIRTAIEMSRAIEDCQHVGADTRQAEDAIDGLVNGTALEIINHIGIETAGTNLDYNRQRDAPLIRGECTCGLNEGCSECGGDGQ